MGSCSSPCSLEWRGAVEGTRDAPGGPRRPRPRPAGVGGPVLPLRGRRGRERAHPLGRRRHSPGAAGGTLAALRAPGGPAGGGGRAGGGVRRRGPRGLGPRWAPWSRRRGGAPGRPRPRLGRARPAPRAGPPPRLPVGSAVPEPGGFPGRWGGASRPQGPPAPPVRPSSTARSPESEEKYRGGHGLVVPWDPPRVRYVTRASVLPRTLDDSPCDCSYEVHPVRSIRSTPLRNRRVGTLPAIPARASLLTRRRCSRRGTPIPDPHRAVWCERR